MIEIDWPDELITSGLAGEERDPEGNLLYRGLKVRVGIHCGVPLCQSDPITERMDYFGQMVNKAARIGAVANPGQILISRSVMKEIEEYKHIMNNINVLPLGLVKLKGIHSDVEVNNILRKFDC